MSGCRIGKIFPKAGGVVRQLPVEMRDDVQKSLVSTAVATVSLYQPSELQGYVLFAWAADGNTTTCFKIEDDSPFGSILLPSIISDAVRAKMVDTEEW